jgi:hypothetical protein
VGRLVPVTAQPDPKRGSSSPPHQRCSACYQTWLFVYKRKNYPGILGIFEKKMLQMCQNYIALPEAVRRSRPEGVLIMTNFGSINSKLETKMALYI